MTVSQVFSYTCNQSIDCSNPTRIVLASDKTQSIWQRVRETVGSWIRDTFFIPLPPVLPPYAEVILNREKEFVSRFWDPSHPVDPNYPLQAEIRDAFHITDQQIATYVDGKQLITTCRIIESKEKGEKYLNFAQVMGSVATIDNDITTSYPYLAAYLERRKEDAALPPARFILISHYQTNSEEGLWRPKTIEEWGKALTQLVETLSKKYQKIHCLIGHSVGTVPLGAALNSLSPSAIPSLLCFERAPSSIESLSKDYWGSSLLYLLAKQTGWSIDLGKELHTFCQKEENPSCIISGVLQDYYFRDAAGLPNHPLVAELETQNKAKVYLFNPPNQLFHPRAHHNLRADLLNGNYLIRSSNQTEIEKKNLAHIVFSRSIQFL